VLLARYSQEEEVVYGVTVAGRPAELEGVERMVGLFINTLAVRTKVKWEQEVGEWLEEQQEQQAEMREYEYSPLMKVQEWSEVGRGEALFDTLLVYENYPVEEAVREEAGAGAGVRVKEVRISETTTNYGVTVIVGPSRLMSLRVSYDESRYESEAMKRLIRQLKVVLLELAQSRTSKLGEIGVLSEAEKEQVLLRLDSLPQTLDEQIESEALHAPNNGQVDGGRPFVAPRTAVEHELAGMWASLLGWKNASIYDNFFESGGNSLLLTQLLLRIKNSFQIDLSLRELFEVPTIIQLTELILAKQVEQLEGSEINDLLASLEGTSAEQLKEIGRTHLKFCK
jgi:non-ribosomal peptide synthetase component F/acyl carrier protein